MNCPATNSILYDIWRICELNDGKPIEEINCVDIIKLEKLVRELKHLKKRSKNVRTSNKNG